MAKEQKDPRSNTDALAILLGDEPPSVEVGGQTIHLVRPDVDEIIPILSKVAQAEGQRDDRGVIVEAGINLSVEAVRICVAEVATRTEAYRLVRLAGGEESALVQTCLSLCGVGGEDADEAVQADPS